MQTESCHKKLYSEMLQNLANLGIIKKDTFCCEEIVIFILL